MKAQESGSSTRAKAAALFNDLAKQLTETGVVDVDGVKVDIPDVLKYKIKYKQKPGSNKLKISLTWPDQTVLESKDSVIDHYQLPDRAPADFKQMKKEMQHALFYFKRLIAKEDLPSAADLDKYSRLQDAFRATATPDWAQGIQEADQATKALSQACDQGDLSAADNALQDLFRIKKKYHDLYK